MPSEKFRLSMTRHSIRQAAHSFLGTFHATTSAPSSCYPLDISLSTLGLMDDTDPSLCIERRSAHNALERQRRESLNSKFQQLAHALPSLQTIRRPSKTMIVAKSLEFVSSAKKRESSYKNQILELRKENERLRKQARDQQHQRAQKQPETVKCQIQIPDRPVQVTEPSTRRDSSTSTSSSETTSLLLSDSCPSSGWAAMDGSPYGQSPVPHAGQQPIQQQPIHSVQTQPQPQQHQQPQPQPQQPQHHHGQQLTNLNPCISTWPPMSLTDEEAMMNSMMPFTPAYFMLSDQTQKGMTDTQFQGTPGLPFGCKSNLDLFYL